LLDRYVELGVALNELNRAMGLMDLAPEVIAPPIVSKLEFVHDLVRGARRPVHAEGGAKL